ncbi:MAG: NADH dehydrogenase FAD-containing subunit [Deltaproteobacteria bacterium]|nr:NADH dehydrogenase FAD-containing subunit [Deltaproteobacteria bacterium]
MIVLFLVLGPMALGIASLLVRGERRRAARRAILVGGAAWHTLGTLATLTAWGRQVPVSWQSFLQLDPIGQVFLLIISVLFFLVAIYSLGYFQQEQETTLDDGVSHLYTPCMLFFLAAMTLTTVTPHFGVLWVAVEATTLASAPLIYYHRHPGALEAAWKYLLICSVGIALALLGLFFVAASGRAAHVDLTVPSLIHHAAALDQRWLRIGCILVLIGFGTKMGLAPLHNWLPDAHSEAPSPVSALLSGALLNCAFLGIVRFYQVADAAGLGAFMNRLLILFGLVSLLVATAFIAGQRDYKRLLAYSSVEHMGILALAVGVGAGAAGLLHAINHSLTKGLLFLVAGQILTLYRTKVIGDVTGLLRTAPRVGTLFAIGGLAIVGAPPFAPFVSEFLILQRGVAHGHYAVMAIYLLCLGIIFVVMSRALFGMLFGAANAEIAQTPALPRRMMIAPALLALGVAGLGLYLPAGLQTLVARAATFIGGGS